METITIVGLSLTIALVLEFIAFAPRILNNANLKAKKDDEPVRSAGRRAA